MKEETGLEVETLYSADVCEQFYDAPSECIWMLPVFVAFVAADAQVTLNREHSAFGWYGFEEAARMVPFAGQRATLAHVEAEFVKREPTRWLLIERGLKR